jgi:hypothetical protein
MDHGLYANRPYREEEVGTLREKVKMGKARMKRGPRRNTGRNK